MVLQATGRFRSYLAMVTRENLQSIMNSGSNVGISLVGYSPRIGSKRRHFNYMLHRGRLLGPGGIVQLDELPLEQYDIGSLMRVASNSEMGLKLSRYRFSDNNAFKN